MKIINLIQKPQLRGAELFACQLSNHLLKLGHEVLVVAIFSGESKLPFDGELITLDRPIAKRFYDISGWKKFSKIAKEFQPDIIQANAADTLKFAVSTKLFFSLSNAKLVFRNANKMGDFISNSLKWHLNKQYINHLDHVISVSKECEIDFKRTFHFDSERIQTIEIGVENAEVGNIPADLLEIFGKSNVISHIGSFVTEKNHLGLIRIIEKIIPRYPNLKVLLIGKGPLEDSIRVELNNRGLQNNFIFLGYRTDVLEILKYSDLFVLPSLIEGLPGVILEAMYCETPVVAYNVGGVGEVVSDETGFLIDKDNEDEFIQSTIIGLEDQNVVESKVQKALTMIHSQFLNDIIAKRFLGAYKDILKKYI